MSTGFTFGGLSSTPSNLGTASTALPSFSSGLTATASANPLGATATTTTTATNTATLTTTTSTSSDPTGPTITFKVLEDHINNWMNDLDSQEKEFLNQACQLNALDRLMIDNGEKIVDLNDDVDRLHKEQEKLEQELEFIMTQQNYLEQSIKKLEDGVDKMPIISSPPPYGSDSDRIQPYQLLIGIDNQLKTMSKDLKQIIDRLNATNVNLNDPVCELVLFYSRFTRERYMATHPYIFVCLLRLYK
jgi:nuclear pore complex protein Nup62